MTDALPPHGGDVSAAATRWGIAPEDWLDLSTGIAPWPYPFGPVPAEAFERLPQARGRDRLIEAASAVYGVHDRDAIRAVAGAQQAISLLPVLLPGRRVAVLGPTYSEHAAAWTGTAAAVTEDPTLDALAGCLEQGGIGVIVNPNNPDGRTVAAATLLDLADRAAAAGGVLVVDEAFCDATPGLSVAGAAGRPGLIVMRSFGKYFGLAGIRLGFCVGPPPLLAALDRLLGPWPVAGPALAIGTAALRDAVWRSAQRHRLEAASGRLRAQLARHGLVPVGGTALFTTVRHEAARDIYRRLAAQGVLVRAFEAMPTLLRFGLPCDPASEERLDRALAAAADAS